MKKYILGLAFGLFFVVTPVQAQVTISNQDAYISALQQVIQLLTEQVSLLIEQLKIVQAKENTITTGSFGSLGSQPNIQNTNTEKVRLVMFSHRLGNELEYRLQSNKPIDFTSTTISQGKNISISSTTEILPNTYKIYLSESIKNWAYGNVNINLVSTDGDSSSFYFEVNELEFNISR